MRPLVLATCAAIGFCLFTAGCSASGKQRAEQLDPLLVEAGFRTFPADTVARHEALSAVQPLKLQYFSYAGALRFWFADPYICHCVYAGNEDNYQRLRELKRERAELLEEETEQQKFLEFEALPANQVFYDE